MAIKFKEKDKIKINCGDGKYLYGEIISIESALVTKDDVGLKKVKVKFSDGFEREYIKHEDDFGFISKTSKKK